MAGRRAFGFKLPAEVYGRVQTWLPEHEARWCSADAKVVWIDDPELAWTAISNAILAAPNVSEVEWVSSSERQAHDNWPNYDWGESTK